MNADGPESPIRRSPSALFVTTVPITLEAFLVPFARHFRNLGWRVDALANGASRNEHIAAEFDRRFDVAWSRNPFDPRNLIGTASAVRRIVIEGGYDIVHVHTPIAAFVTRYALSCMPRARRPVVIYTAHGFHFYHGQSALPHAAYRMMERMAGSWTDFLVTINDEDFRAARALGSLPADRVRLIPGIGVDTDTFRPGSVPAEKTEAIRAVWGVPEDAFLVAMVAEFAPVKRHGHLFSALSQVRDPRVVVALIGNGPLESSLREKAVALGVNHRIRWAGYRRDIPDVLAACDALTLVSEREGLARSVLEAMASGLPVIGTDTRGIADAVGDAGWIVPKRDTAALARAFDEAAGDRDAARALGREARQRVESEFSLDAIIRDYEDLYDEALASRL